MAKSVKTSLDFNKNEIQNVVVQKLASAPSGPVSGQIYFNTTDNKFYYYSGNSWVALTAVPSVVNVGTGANPLGVFKGVNNESLEFRKIDANDSLGNNSLNTELSGDCVKLVLTPSLIPHGELANVGTNSHIQIDNHIASTSNPHSVTKSQVGLGNVTNDAQLKASDLDTDIALTANSDTKIPSQKAVKTYIDGKVTGASWKESVRAATTANITLSGTQSIDGVAVVVGDRVLVKNQTTASQNGIYVVASGSWTRALDNDTSAEMINATVMVQEGTTNADTQWTCSTNAPITLGTTSLTFVQMSGAGTYSAGTGLALSGNQFSIDTNTTIDKTTTQTLTNKTLTSPRIGIALLDVNGNEVIKTPATASAVNEITVVNAATGNNVQIQTTGDDANISLNLVSKGTGKVKVNNVNVLDEGWVDTDNNLSSNSDTKIPSQRAVKTYVDTRTKYYKGAINNVNTGLIAADIHLCGTAPSVQVYEVSGSTASLIECDITVNTVSGNVTWSTSSNITGYIVIIGK